MIAKIMIVFSVLCGIGTIVALNPILGAPSLVLGSIVFCLVLFILACINAYVINGTKVKPKQEVPSAYEGQYTYDDGGKEDLDSAFNVLTGLCMIGGVVLGIWLNWFLGESSMLTWLGAWIVLEFVAIVLYGLFRRPRKTEEIQVQLVSRPDVVHDVSTPVKRTSENKVYETDLSEIERPCEECGEYNCLSLIRHGNDESFIRCNNCFALQSLNKIAGRDSTFFPMALNDMLAYDSQSAIALLHEVMKYQTLEEINAINPMLFPTIFRSYFNDDACSEARAVLREISGRGKAWAGALSAYFRQYSKSRHVEYPSSDSPDPTKLAHAFELMLDAVDGMDSKQAEEQIAIFDLFIDMYAHMESNCMEKLSEYLQCITQAARSNDFNMTPLKEVATLLAPFESASSRFADIRPLFEEKLDILGRSTGSQKHIELLKRGYGVLYPADQAHLRYA